MPVIRVAPAETPGDRLRAQLGPATVVPPELPASQPAVSFADRVRLASESAARCLSCSKKGLRMPSKHM